jgi:hypothetical protein
MKILGIVDSTTQNDNSHTLVKVALKYVETLKIDTEIIAVDEIDFTNNKETDALQKKVKNVDALLVATTFSVEKEQTDVDPFLAWFKTIDDQPHLRAGTMMLIEPIESLQEYDEHFLSKQLKQKKVSIVLNRVFTKLKESSDARSNTYILTQAMDVGEEVAKKLKQ